MQLINLKTQSKVQMIEISRPVQDAVKKSKTQSGTCFIFVPHTTAGITINENADPSVRQDIQNHLNKNIPAVAGYTHSEGNAPAHIKASLLGSHAVVFIENGELALGTWQGIFFCEFDGPRSRQVWVKTIGK